METNIDDFLVSPNFIFQSLANNDNDYVYLWDIKANKYMISVNFAEDFSMQQKGENFREAWEKHVHPRDIDRIDKYFYNLIKSRKTKVRFECQVANAKGFYVWLTNKATLQYVDGENEPVFILGVLSNLEYEGSVDSVTGLLMHDKCEETFSLMQNNKTEFNGCVMLLGIDEFTSINTLNNHLFGDLVLRNTVQNILDFLPENTSMYRFDGDQFLIAGIKMSKLEMREIYNKIKNYTMHSHTINDQAYRFTMSAGIASYPENGITWNDLEKAISIALRSAKESGKNRCVEFTNKMLKEKIYEQSLSRYLFESVEQDFVGFHLLYQPVCFAQTLRTKGSEALLRFETPDKKIISPIQFIPLLEQSQLIIPVGLWVLEQAIITCKKWTYYIPDFVMNVNVSYIQLREIDFCDKVEQLLKKYDLATQHLTLELTESYFITDATNINISMKRLKELHLQVAMDDFGTGYSSLARLSQFNVDVVKIDRSFVQSLHKSKYNHDFVDSVVRLCHNVGMKVCVEGVETRNEQTSICTLNVDFIQGFYVSRPVDEELFFTKFISASNTNDKLVVEPSMQLRHKQLVGDRDVLLAMMDASPLALNFWNKERDIIACNVKVLNLFEAKDFEDFKKNFFRYSPIYQPDGKKSVDKAKEMIDKAFKGERQTAIWHHCDKNNQIIPCEVFVVRIPYMDDYVVASFTRDMRDQMQMEDQIRKFSDRLKAILDATPLCLNLWNKQFQNIMCNKEAVKLFNLKNEGEYVKHFFELSPEYQPDGELSNDKALNCIKEAFEKGRKTFFWMHCNLKKEEIPAEITLVKIDGLGEDGEDLVAGYTRDIREEIKSQKMQQDASDRIRAVLDSMPLACILWSLDKTVLDCNQVAINTLAAKNKKEIINYFDRFNPINQPDGCNSIDKKNEKFQEAIEKGKSTFEWVYKSGAEEEIPCEVSLIRVPLESEDIIVAYSRDLRELHQTLELNDRLTKIAYYDLLTGTASRAKFMEKLEENFNQAKLNQHFALLIFDIDHFKSVNDTYGHAMGDIVLKKVSKFIEKSIPDKAMLGRFGGDEFMIQLQSLSKKELEALMKELVESVSQLKFYDESTTFTTSISIGGSFKSKEDYNYHDLLKRADKALYKAKTHGRNCTAIL